MPVTMESLGIDRMNLEDRKDLVRQILDSIATEAGPPPLSPGRKAEFGRRRTDYLANPDDVIPREQVRDEALARSFP